MRVLANLLTRTITVYALCLVFIVECKQIRLLELQPMTGSSWPGGPACIAPVQMAIDDVHAYEGLLDGYNITYDVVDSQVL